MAWAHSTSSAISSAHPASVRGKRVPPRWSTFLKQPLALVHRGRPKVLLKIPRSLSTSGWSYASTIATVFPPPAVEPVAKPYTDLIVAGESPVGALVANRSTSVTTRAWQRALSADAGPGHAGAAPT